MVAIVPTPRVRRKTKWHLPQFSLRTLLALVTGAALVLALDAYQTQSKRARELAVYSAALRHLFKEPPTHDEHAVYLSLGGKDPPWNFADLGLLPASRAYAGGGSEPDISIYDKDSGKPGTVITLRILQWEREGRVKIQYDSQTSPLWGSGHIFYLRLKDKQWQFDGEDDFSFWVS